jgi:transcription-repair coupling factor (superfamily II helicase)
MSAKKRSKPTGIDPLAAVSETEAFGGLVRALSEDGGRARCEGLWGASAGLVLAAWVTHSRRPLLVIAPTPEAADRLESDLATFIGREVAPFPAYDIMPGEADTPEMPVLSARLAALKKLAEPAPEEGPREFPAVAVGPVTAAMQPVPAPGSMHESEQLLSIGADVGHAALVDWLHSHGLERVPSITGRGEFAVRGGIVDIFPLYSDTLVTVENEERPSELPVRVEFFGERVESLRTFDPITQRSVADVTEFHVPGVERDRARDPYTFGTPGRVADHLPEDACVAVFEPDDCAHGAKLYAAVTGPGDVDTDAAWGEFLASFGERAVVEITRTPGDADEGASAEKAPTASVDFDVVSVQRVSGRAEDVGSRLRDLAGRLSALTVYCRDATEEARLTQILRRAKVKLPDYYETRRGHVSGGFEFRGLTWAALADHEVLGVTSEHRRARERVRGEPIADFLDLSPGDYVVHTTHGVARYLGMTTLEKDGGAEDFLTLLFADKVKVYVPAGHAYLVERYVGAGTGRPTLSKVGGNAWTRRKARAAKAVQDIAADLLKTQANRARTEGLAYPPDSDWQLEFEAAFPYEETADQLAATAAIKGDMERPVPMDRLLCGDVGFGKTEVAMRAAYKAVEAGRQVAILVPTTLLAEQHGKTFSERFTDHPMRVEALSRFLNKGQQKAVLADLAGGRVDVVIGTHRLLSKDVAFRDLGLVVIDEEQRFGVEHKERLKKMRLAVDVLTLTATPIPRTLHMSLVGLRDISSLTIPPEDRLSIRTKVCRWSDDLIRRSVLRELARGGQVYFVHDRVMDIEMLTSRLRRILPEARYATVHGQMSPHDLDEHMRAFLRREVDVLVSTTIIESGLDIPSVNTIFIHNADRFGLAELHQLRGRVGRYRHQAYAYLLVPEGRTISVDAEKRLRAVEEFEELGAGFKLAMRDLEIRGAGNLLGAEQSGRIAEIGYELYCRILERAVRKLKGERVQEPLDVTLALEWGASLPREYVPDEVLRLEMYRKLARCRDAKEVALVRDEMRDRFGGLPPAADRVLAESRIRIAAQRASVPYIAREITGERGRAVFKMREPNFMRLEKCLAGTPGTFSVAGEDSFAVHLPAYLLEDDALEETVVRVLKKLV